MQDYASYLAFKDQEVTKRVWKTPAKLYDEHHILQTKTALPGDPFRLATLLNDNDERRSTSVARIITGCECYRMRAERRASLDF